MWFNFILLFRFLGILMLKKPPVKISDVKAALEVLLTSLANTYSNKLSGKNSKIFSLPILIKGGGGSFDTFA